MKEKEDKYKNFAKMLLKEAFWGDTTLTEDVIMEILSDPSREKERFYLFQRALFNLKEPAILTQIFSEEEIKKYLGKINFSQRFPYLSERIKIWRNIFLGEKNEIPRIKWKFFT